MAPHSNTLAWKIPWMEEPGRLQSVGSRRVGHDWAASLSLFTFMHWRRKWQPTPVFLPENPRDGVAQSWTQLKWLSSSIYSYRSTYMSSIVTTNPKPTTDRAFLVSQLVRNLPAVQESLNSIPGLGRSPVEGNGKPLQYSCLEKTHGQRSLVWATAHGIARARHNLATTPPPQHIYKYLRERSKNVTLKEIMKPQGKRLKEEEKYRELQKQLENK